MLTIATDKRPSIKLKVLFPGGHTLVTSGKTKKGDMRLDYEKLNAVANIGVPVSDLTAWTAINSEFADLPIDTYTYVARYKEGFFRWLFW